MDTQKQLQNITAQLLAPGKGILAADESNRTCDERFDKNGIPKTPEMRREWRELLFTTPEVEKNLSGVILFDETIRQHTSGGVPFAELLSKRGIIPGIKVDTGTVDLPNFPDQKITEGLDGLSRRLDEYRAMGAKFTKWRAVIKIGEEIPTLACIKANAFLMVQYVVRSQQAELVPIGEPEVLLGGRHDIHESSSVMVSTLRVLFEALEDYRVDLSGMILKSSMALPGKDSDQEATSEEVASETLKVFYSVVPKELAGIVFLSGGQSPLEATQNLNTIAKFGKNAPWPLTFSYSRALQEPAMARWLGKDENKQAAQEIFRTRVEETAAASTGEYNG